MIFYIILLGTLAWPTSKCEPPVNSYLPPFGIGPSSISPSSQYGPPGSGGAGASQRGNQLGARQGQNRPQDSYSNGKTGTSIDTQYGIPSTRNKQGTQSFGSPSGAGSNQSTGTESSSSFGNSAGVNTRPQSSYGPRPSQRSGSKSGGDSGSEFQQKSQSSYGPPPTGDFGRQSGSQRLTSQGTQGLGSQNGFNSGFGGRQTGGSLSSTYGVPGFEGQPGGGQLGGFAGRAGGFFSGRGSGSGQNYELGESNEPAKYEFSYEVDDSQTGTKFGHSEQRDGDLATGQYNVVLPDGRKQVVEYEAGTQGYKPQIHYEGGGMGALGSGFGRGSDGAGGQAGTQGYPRGGPDSNNGFPVSGQDPSSARYQDAAQFGQGNLESSVFNGYASDRPGGRIGAVSQRGSGLTMSQFSSGSGIEDLNGGQRSGYSNLNSPLGRNGGYSSGSSGGNDGNGEGYPRGGPGSQNSLQGGRGLHNNPSGGRGRSGFGGGDDTEGYPSGGPSGSRGTGY